MADAQDHIADCDNRQMACECVKRRAIAFFEHLQVLFAGFEVMCAALPKKISNDKLMKKNPNCVFWVLRIIQYL